MLNTKQTARLKEVLQIMHEESFGHLLYEANLLHKSNIIDILQCKLTTPPEEPPQVRLRKIFERLGPAFVKIGQILSTRPDLLPAKYIEELEKLQQNVKPVPWKTIEKSLEQQLGKKIRSVFRKIDKEPVAAASVAQVYKATLKNGKTVAIKIQRPGIKEQLETDFQVLNYITSILDRKVAKLHRYHIKGVVKEFERWTREEIDFTNEAKHTIEFAQMLKSWKSIKIPKVYDEYTTDQLLVLEYINGTPLADYQANKKRKKDIIPLIKEGFKATLYTVFEHGKFHADPHPGNFLVTKNNKIALLDFGIVGNFNPWLRKYMTELFAATINQDSDKIAQLLLDISTEPSKVNLPHLKHRIQKSIRELDQSITDVNIGKLFQEALNGAVEANIDVPVEFVLFSKTIVTSEGVALKYDKGLNLCNEARPFIERTLLKQVEQELTADSTKAKVYNIAKASADLPVLLQRILKKFEEGSVKLQIRDTDIKHLAVNMRLSINKLSYAIIAASCIMAGSLTSATQPQMSSLLYVCAIAAILMFLRPKKYKGD